MRTRRWQLLLMLLTLSTVAARGQQFFNLTADDVRVDSLLPQFVHTFPLPANHADSVYTVSIVYPEFMNLSERAVEAYHRLTDEPLRELPVVEQRVVTDRKQPSLRVAFTPLVKRKGREQMLVSFMLKVEAKGRAGATGNRTVATPAVSRQTAAGGIAEHSVLATGKWAKIRVPQTGVYQLTEALARKAGFSDLSHVKVYGYGGALQNEKLVASELAQTDDLREVPLCVVGGKRLFHAQGPVTWTTAATPRRVRNPYSDYGYYFITESEDEPLTVDSAQFVGAFYPTSADYHTLHEIDNYAWYRGGRNLVENTPIEVGTKKSFVLTTPGLATTGKLTASISAGKSSTVRISMNGVQVGTMNITFNSNYDHKEQSSSTQTYNVSNIGVNDTITVECVTGGPLRPDYFDLYFATPRPEPWLTVASFAEPEYVYNITNQDRHADGPADLVIIIPTSQKWRSQAERLGRYHQEHDGMRFNVVPADELYNEFSSGTPDANAYRRYLKMLYDRAETEADQPKNLLLFGDGVWDNRMLTSDCRQLSADDYLLCFESEESYSHTDCYVDDCWFTLLDEGEGTNPQSADLADCGVGRLPASSEAEATLLVDKAISYMENREAGAWLNTVMFLGDDGDDFKHMIAAREASYQFQENFPDYYVRTIMWDAYTRETSSTGNSYPQVTEIIKRQMANGALIIDYCGHGAEHSISHEGVLSIADFENFQNTRMPLWITASCDIMPFDKHVENIGEAAVLNKRGGAVAFFGTTRTVYAEYNRPINDAFMAHIGKLVDGKPITLGEAQRQTKNYLITSGDERRTNKLNYQLLGDPALALKLPTKKVVVDEINGCNPRQSASAINLKAGAIATVKGHVEDLEGHEETGFDGVVAMTVRDTEEEITGHNYEGSDSNFSFRDRSKILFNGTDSVRAGRFEFTFAVPMDLNYANGTGLINLHAYNNERNVMAQGSSQDFLVGGTEAVSNDSIGPSIYCYLNTPSFANGGNVNTTPYFVAQITDKDGINAAGNGIGHDLELVIDGELTRTYNLNDHFSFDFGSYTQGSTYYNIPALEPGPHKLKFRAWDVLNNSSVSELTFNVVRSLQPELYSVACTNNPAREETTFIVSHDRQGSEMDVDVEVYDLSGRLLWRNSEANITTSGAYTLSWNLTTSSGKRLNTGVYVYRVRVASDGSSKTSKARKLIVM